MSCLVWVLGAGGLLGRELVRVFRQRATLYAPDRRFEWTDADAVQQQLAANLEQFTLQTKAYDRWCVAWCAGVGTVGTVLRALEAETAILKQLLLQIAASELTQRRGNVFLASSAGGVYGGSEDRPLTEVSGTLPLSDYGRNKIEQERLIAEVLTTVGIPHLIGRISNLYGPGQNLGKPQGFISQLLRSVILRRTINVYVPLDTRRDFLFAADCAEHVVECLELVRRPETVTKIFANGQSATMHQVIAVAGRVTRQRPQAVFQPSVMAKQQPQAHWYVSRVLPELTMPRRTSLQVGMKAVSDALRLQYQLGFGASSARAG